MAAQPQLYFPIVAHAATIHRLPLPDTADSKEEFDARQPDSS